MIFLPVINKLNKRGMSLVELTISVGLLSLITLSSTLLIQSNIKSNVSAERRANYLQESALLTSVLKNQNNGTITCMNLISLNSAFSTTSTTPLTITVKGESYQDGYVSPSGAYRIERLYLASPDLLSKTVNNATYATQVMMESSIKKDGSWFGLPRSMLSGMSVKVNNSGVLVDCNLDAFEISPSDVCATVEGMIWSPQANACVSEVLRENDGSFTECDGAFQKDFNGDCVPTETNCVYDSRMPRDVENGLMAACEKLSASYNITHDPRYNPLPDYTPPTPSPTPPPTQCQCGNNYLLNQGEYCLSCRQEDNCYNVFESCYYYTVERCDQGPTLTKITGPSYQGTFKVKSDPPSGFTCSRSRAKGYYNPTGSPVAKQMYP